MPTETDESKSGATSATTLTFEAAAWTPSEEAINLLLALTDEEFNRVDFNTIPVDDPSNPLVSGITPLWFICSLARDGDFRLLDRINKLPDDQFHALNFNAAPTNPALFGYGQSVASMATCINQHRFRKRISELPEAKISTIDFNLAPRNSEHPNFGSSVLAILCSKSAGSTALILETVCRYTEDKLADSEADDAWLLDRTHFTVADLSRLWTTYTTIHQDLSLLPRFCALRSGDDSDTSVFGQLVGLAESIENNDWFGATDHAKDLEDAGFYAMYPQACEFLRVCSTSDADANAERIDCALELLDKVIKKGTAHPHFKLAINTIVGHHLFHGNYQKAFAYQTLFPNPHRLNSEQIKQDLIRIAAHFLQSLVSKGDSVLAGDIDEIKEFVELTFFPSSDDIEFDLKKIEKNPAVALNALQTKFSVHLDHLGVY